VEAEGIQIFALFSPNIVPSRQPLFACLIVQLLPKLQILLLIQNPRMSAPQAGSSMIHVCGRYRLSRLDRAFLAREFGLREEDIPDYADELDNAPARYFPGQAVSQDRYGPEAGQIGDNAVGEMKRAIERERQEFHQN
jgi:hypothetical protein